jgi:hypothetical protein
MRAWLFGGGAALWAVATCLAWWAGPVRTQEPDKQARSHLPKQAKDREFIGAFTLNDGSKHRSVALYYEDSDLTMGRHGFAIYPNFFSVHAAYRENSGKWVHRPVCSAARVGFVRVLRATPAAVVLELRPKFIIDIRPNEKGETDLKKAAEINKPFAMCLSFEKGVLTAK